MVAGLLQRIPTESDLEHLYWELAALGAPSVGRPSTWSYAPRSKEELIVLAAEMLRYDPRLLSILLELLLKSWRQFDPRQLRERLHAARCPQALCVVLDFVLESGVEPELRYFAEYVRRGWNRVEPRERFFLDAERPGSRMARRKAGRNLAPYARWGFIGTERPTADANRKRTVGRYDAATRRVILDELSSARDQLRIGDYLDAVDHSITRQQALADLKACDALHLVGAGRGARWVRRRPKRRPLHVLQPRRG